MPVVWAAAAGGWIDLGAPQNTSGRPCIPTARVRFEEACAETESGAAKESSRTVNRMPVVIQEQGENTMWAYDAGCQWGVVGPVGVHDCGCRKAEHRSLVYRRFRVA